MATGTTRSHSQVASCMRLAHQAMAPMPAAYITPTWTNPWYHGLICATYCSRNLRCLSVIMARPSSGNIVSKKAAAGPPPDGGHERRCGNREDPGPDDVARDTPPHRRELARGSHAHDGACDRVRRGHRNAQRACDEEDRKSTRLNSSHSSIS